MGTIDLKKNIAVAKAVILINKRAKDSGVSNSMMKVLCAMITIPERVTRPCISEVFSGHSNGVDIKIMDNLVRAGLIDKKQIFNKYNKRHHIFGYLMTDKGHVDLDYILNGGVRA
jgi:hypothetical protein